MEQSANRPNRQSHRYKDFDYASAGAYFVTFCIRGGECILGHIKNNEMVLNAAGNIVQKCWGELVSRFPMITLDEFQVMPNHVHLLLWLLADPEYLKVLGAASSTAGAASSAPTLGEVMRAFKSITAIEVNRCLN